jgi:hypothetical protein
MKKCTSCLVIKDKTCFSASKARKDGLQGMCKDCAKLKWQDFAKKNKEYLAERDRERYIAMAPIICEQKRQKRLQDIQLARANYKRHYFAHHEKNKKKAAAWQKANMRYFVDATNKRRLMKMNRIPAWADMADIESKYVLARKITQVTGITHHVDHVVPLKGELVSGLHVANNLMVVSAEYNNSKYNNWTP